MGENLNSQRILITGGRGCLARVIARHFVSQGTDVKSFSRTGGAPHQMLEELFTSNQFESAGSLLHLAWSTVPYVAEQKTDGGVEQDLGLLTKILTWLAATPERKRLHFIFFSSGGTVYGNAEASRPSREIDSCLPIGRHGQAKLVAEQLIESEGRKHGLCWTILRISNPYGFAVPITHPQGIIPVALKSAWEGKPLTIWGDGTARKDYLHYSDFLSALEKIVRLKLTGIYNVCSGHSPSICELLKLVEQTTGRPILTRHIPAHSWDVHDSLIDNAKLCAAIDWHPAMTLADGIRCASTEIKMP